MKISLLKFQKVCELLLGSFCESAEELDVRDRSVEPDLKSFEIITIKSSK